MTRAELESKMTVLMGGRASEQVVFGHFSTGAADDLAKVTDIARSMAMRFGMVDKLGHVTYEAERPAFINIPGMVPGPREFSEDTAREIDCAVRDIVTRAFDRAITILTEKRSLLEQGAQLLLQKETLIEEDLQRLRQLPAPAAIARSESALKLEEVVTSGPGTPGPQP
jgi:cell division protease FtsH